MEGHKEDPRARAMVGGLSHHTINSWTFDPCKILHCLSTHPHPAPPYPMKTQARVNSTEQEQMLTWPLQTPGLHHL